MRVGLVLVLVAMRLAVAATNVSAADLLSVDLNGAGGPTTTVAGWTGWNPGTGSTASTTIGAYGVTIFTPVSGYAFDGRARGTPQTENGNGFIPSGLGHMYRDLVFVAAGGNQGRAVLGVTITGLTPNTDFNVTAYAYDNNTAGTTNYTATPPSVNAEQQVVGYDFSSFPNHVSLTWQRPFNEFGDGANTPPPGVSLQITSNASGVGSFYAWGGDGANGNPNATSTYLNGFTISSLTAPPSFEADFDGDLNVDGDDLGDWIDGFGMFLGATRAEGDANMDETVDGIDFLIWQNQFGSGVENAVAAVPEPSAVSLTFVMALTVLGRLRRAAPGNLLDVTARA